MSSLIEKAAQRLDQLRQAGVVVSDASPAAVSAPVSPGARQEPVMPAQEVAAPGADAESRVLSKRVEIDLERLHAAGFVTPHAQRSLAADEFRVIKRPLLDNASGKGAAPVANGNLIMVTSAMPAEGKSFMAINLAISMAMELDYRVLLVDADVAKPSLMKTLGLPPGPGLLDLLLNPDADMADVMLRTNVEKLTLLPSGSQHPRATELLASDAMTSLVEEIGRRYEDRIIIFDSPPLLLTTESRVLATHMGQIVMVVQAEKTLQSQVRHALSTIEGCPVKLLVLNQARGGDQAAYGYGYGYGYGQEARPAKSKGKKEKAVS
jgi:exopolysaccharide/PEP-CTERM locus tyrosine autokinase